MVIFNFIFIPAAGCYAQSDSLISIADTTDLINNSSSDNLLENIPLDTEDPKLIDFIDNITENPFDLNSASQKELESIPYLNTFTAGKIIELRRKKGGFKSKKDILRAEGMTGELYADVGQFLFVKNSPVDYLVDENDNILKEKPLVKNILFPNMNFVFRSRFEQSLQPGAGYLDGTYLGSRARIYNQLTSKYSCKEYSLEGSITLEKDAGERSLTDFSSIYFKLSNFKFIKEAVIGYYSLNFGQGLALWSPIAYSKGNITVDPVKKRCTGIEGYNSLNEVLYFRGPAAHLNFNRYNIFVFYSDHFIDATLDTSIDEASGIYKNGYHRTTSEINRENSVKETLSGARINYDDDILRFGITYWDSRFSKQFKADSTAQYYSFSGDYANMMSFDYDFLFRNMNFYGEIANSHNGAIAGLANVQMTFTGIANIVFSYRNYAKDFMPLHSYGFGNNNTQNETGFYAGIQFKPLKGLSVNTYYDIFKYPYRTYYTPLPTNGNDFLLHARYHFNSNLTLELKYKNENKEELRTIKDINNRNADVIDTRNQINLRTGFEYRITNNFRIRSRVEYVYTGYKYYGGDNKGIIFYTDARFVPINNLITNIRIIYFQTDSYDSRIYQNEDDIKGIMANPALYGKGTRWYIALRYLLNNFFEINAKYSETNYENVTTVGSGNDLINGNIDNKLSLGVDVKF